MRGEMEDSYDPNHNRISEKEKEKSGTNCILDTGEKKEL